jgi:hypothetical protein
MHRPRAGTHTHKVALDQRCPRDALSVLDGEQAFAVRLALNLLVRGDCDVNPPITLRPIEGDWILAIVASRIICGASSQADKQRCAENN